jgi:signal transduction histidine kinase
MAKSDNNNHLGPHDLGLLNQIGREFASTLDLRIVIGRVMSRVKEVLDCRASSVILYDEVKDTLVFYAASGAGAREVMGLTIPKGRGIAGWVYVHGSPIIISDAAEDARFYSGIDRITGVETKTLICVPIKKDDRTLGVIEGLNKVRDTFDQKDLDMLNAISQLAAIAIENSKNHANLERRNSDLMQQNRELEEFVHIVSHDLQTPLVSIEGYSRLIRAEVSDLQHANAAVDAYLERIEENCKNTLQFVRRLLEYSKLRNKSIVIDVFNPLGVLGEVLEQLRDVIEERRAQLIYPNSFPTVRYDRSLFHHILLNLIQNSLKYASVSNGGTQSEPPTIEVGVEEEEYEYHFYVRDNGPGLSKEDQRRIFNIYERGGTAELTDGYGIGLAFVKKAVQLMNGTVWVESRKGEGTTFLFSIQR